jgi:pyridinium-3,5-biscarboxylic acid mononucleotide sulfurtransferase
MTINHPANTEKEPDQNLEQKRRALYDRLGSIGRLMVAYSGGTDSAYLAYTAHQVLGNEMLAVIADSPSLARADLQSAIDFATAQSIPLRIVQTNELADPDYVRNSGDRCFHCKDELFDVMSTIRDYPAVAYGMNLDDIGDFRPGQKAAAQHNVLAPLAEAGLTKAEIRDLARQAGLSVWDRPAAACLSSRIAYGLPVTRETLDRIEQGEAFLASLGLRQFRVRHHGDIARIEIARAEMEQIFSLTIYDQISSTFKRLGYKFVTLDLEGFRSGSMNALLPASTIGWNNAEPAPNTSETTR